MRKLNDKMIKELCIICTRNESGQHFTETSDYWEDFETLGLITVDRPTHEATGIIYGQEHYTLEVTDKGFEVVEANEELWPTA